MAPATDLFSSEYMMADQGPHILAAAWFMTTLGMLGVGGRLFIRYRVLKRGSADDWWMFGGLAFLVILTALITRMAGLGGFRHETTLSPTDASTVRKLFWATQPVGAVGSLLPKISIGLQLLYILPQSSLYNWQRWSIYASVASCVLVTILVFPMTFAQCSPLSALWAPAASYPRYASNPQCWPTSTNTAFFTFVALWNALVDLILAVIPIGLIVGLQIKALKKALLANFLGARLFACISGITRAVYIARYGFYGTGLGTAHDFTWQAFNILLWQVAEQFCLCFCGSVPAYKAMYDRWASKRSSLRVSEGSTFVDSERMAGSRASQVSRDKDWFYERKCFSDVDDPRITVTTEINVQHEQWTDSPSGSETALDHELKTIEHTFVKTGELSA